MERSATFVKAGLSSGIATGVDFLALVALVEVGSVHVTLAAFLAACLGGMINFSLNKVWAFRDQSRWRVSQALSYAWVSVVNALFVAAVVHLLAVEATVPYVAAKAIAAVVVFALWSYPAQARFVFPR